MDVNQQKRHSTVPINVKKISQHLEKVLQASHLITTQQHNNTTCTSISRLIVTIIFWTVIYLAGSYLTITESIDLIQQYQSNPTFLSITNKKNKTMNIPEYTICFPISATTFFYRISNDSETPYSDALRAFFGNNTKGEVFSINQEDTFADEVYIIVWNYLAMIYEGEYLTEENLNPFLSLNQGDDEWTAMANILIPKITSLNITIDQIKAIFDGKFANFYYSLPANHECWRCPYVCPCGYSMTTPSIYTEDNLSTPGFYKCFLNVVSNTQNSWETESDHKNCLLSRDIVFIDRSHICFKVRHLVDTLDDVRINYNTTILLINDNTNEDLSNEANGSVTIDFSGRNTPPYSRNGNIFVLGTKQIGSYNTIQISIIGVFKSLPVKNGMAVCSDDQTLNECQLECRIRLIKKFCGCTPMILSPLSQDQDSTATTCTFDTYSRCLNYSGNEDENCTASCLPSCERSLYRFQPYRFQTYSPITRVNVYFDSFDYVYYEEKYQWTFGLFVSALGGILGMWMGLDFVVLIEFIFKPTMLIVRKFCSTESNDVQNFQVENESTENCGKKLTNLLRKYANVQMESRFKFAMWIFEKVFWTGIYTAGGIGTVYYCVLLCLQYGTSPTFSLVSPMFNQSITLPPATVCTNEYVDLSYLESDPGSITYSTLLIDSLNNTSKESLLNSEIEWPTTLKVVAFWYICVMNVAETTNMSFWNIQFNILSEIQNLNILLKYTADCFRFETKTVTASQFNNIIYSIKYILEPKLNELNISMEEFRQKLGSELIQLYQMKIKFVQPTNSTHSTAINILRMSFLDTHTCCFQIPLHTVTFTDTRDFVEISINDSSYYGVPLGISLSLFNNYTALPTILDNVEGTAKLPFIYSGLGEHHSITVGIKNYFQQISTAENPCTSDNTREICQIKCRIQTIEKNCNCSPTTWPMLLSPGAKECTLKEYHLCMHFNLTQDAECSNNCPMPCAEWEIFSTDELIQKDTASNVTTNRIFVRSFTYIAIEDQYMFTFTNLLSNLGGMLGIWIGLDVRFVAWIIIWPLALVFKIFVNRRIKQANSIFNGEKSEQMLRLEKSWITKSALLIFDFQLPDYNREVAAKWMFKTIPYSVYYVAGIFLTGIMCQAQYQQFTSGISQANYTIMENKTIQFSPTLCIPLPVSEQETVQGEFAEFLTSLPVNSEKLIEEEYEWPNFFLSTTLSYLTLLNHYERFERSGENYELTHGDASQWEYCQLLDKYLNLSNIPISKMIQKCGREVEKGNSLLKINIHLLRYNKSSETYNITNIDLDKTTYIDEKQVCYKLPFHEFEFRSLHDFIAIEITRNSLLETNYTLDTITLDLLGRDFITNGNDVSVTFDSVIPYKFGQIVNSVLTIETITNALPFSNGVTKCSMQTQNDCRNVCRIKAIREKCNCIPATFSSSISSNYCQCILSQYENCSPISNAKLQSCMSNCLSFCTITWISNSDKIPSTFLSENKTDFLIENEITYLSIHMGSFDYFLVIESYQYTLSTFFGAIGGTLGFWIGLDFLCFVHLFYSAVLMVGRTYQLVKIFLLGRNQQLAE